jgi:tetratricopeptide (TPR) repeat protein
MNDQFRQAQEHYERGNSFDEARDAARAIQEWEIAVRLNPNYFDAHYNLAVAYADEGDLTRAVDEMDMAFRLDPDDQDVRRELVEMLIERGDAFSAQKDATRAIQDWERALEIDSESAQAHFKLGQVCADAGKFADAESHFRAAIKVNRFFTDAYDQLAEIYVTQDHNSDAINVLRKALNIFNSSFQIGVPMHYDLPVIEGLQITVSVSDLARNLAELELDNGNPDRAMAALEQARPSANDKEMWQKIADSLKVKGDTEAAEIATNRALEVEQNGWDETATINQEETEQIANSHFERGEILSAQEDNEAAFEAYSEAIRINPNHAGAHYGLGLIYLQDKEYLLAEQEFKEVVRIDPVMLDGYFGLAALYDEREDWQNAIREYREVLRIHPNDAEAREKLIWDLLETNAPGDAQAELQRGEFEPNTAAELWLGIGKSYEDRGGHANAIAAYQRAVELDKKLKSAREGLKRLGA